MRTVFDLTTQTHVDLTEEQIAEHSALNLALQQGRCDVVLTEALVLIDGKLHVDLKEMGESETEKHLTLDAYEQRHLSPVEAAGAPDDSRSSRNGYAVVPTDDEPAGSSHGRSRRMSSVAEGWSPWRTMRQSESDYYGEYTGGSAVGDRGYRYSAIGGRASVGSVDDSGWGRRGSIDSASAEPSSVRKQTELNKRLEQCGLTECESVIRHQGDDDANDNFLVYWPGDRLGHPLSDIYARLDAKIAFEGEGEDERALTLADLLMEKQSLECQAKEEEINRLVDGNDIGYVRVIPGIENPEEYIAVFCDGSQEPLANLRIRVDLFDHTPTLADDSERNPEALDDMQGPAWDNRLRAFRNRIVVSKFFATAEQKAEEIDADSLALRSRPHPARPAQRGKAGSEEKAAWEVYEAECKEVDIHNALIQQSLDALPEVEYVFGEVVTPLKVHPTILASKELTKVLGEYPSLISNWQRRFLNQGMDQDLLPCMIVISNLIRSFINDPINFSNTEKLGDHVDRLLVLVTPRGENSRLSCYLAKHFEQLVSAICLYQTEQLDKHIKENKSDQPLICHAAKGVSEQVKFMRGDVSTSKERGLLADYARMSGRVVRQPVFTTAEVIAQQRQRESNLLRHYARKTDRLPQSKNWRRLRAAGKILLGAGMIAGLGATIAMTGGLAALPILGAFWSTITEAVIGMAAGAYTGYKGATQAKRSASTLQAKSAMFQASVAGVTEQNNPAYRGGTARGSADDDLASVDSSSSL